MRKIVLAVLVSFMLLSVGAAQAAPSRNSAQSINMSKSLFIQAAETSNDAYGMLVSDIIGGNARITVLYPDVVLELPVIEYPDGSLAVMAIGFAGYMYWHVAIPITKNRQGQDTIPLIPYLNTMFDTSDGGHLYVPMQDPEVWLPWRPIIMGTLF